MNDITTRIEQYVWEILGIHAASHPWDGSGTLPLYLRDRYHFFQMDLLGTKCMLMVDLREEEQQPGVVGKQLDQVRS
ncbi:MAG TPA: hypothetical protein VHS28_03025, partial [Chloroflexota bacterium]|nr:hypothetical protein [Chloroflexota bacterium]